MKDTMAGFMKLLDEDISNYTTKINLVETAENSAIMELVEKGYFSHPRQ